MSSRYYRSRPLFVAAEKKKIDRQYKLSSECLQWSVMQYTIVRPAISIAGIITEKYNVLCTSSWSYKYANVYLASVDFVSIS